MEKLFRLIILTVIFIVLLSLIHCIIPTLSLLFGGGFLVVIQHPFHIIFMTIIGCIAIGLAYDKCFDEDFLSK